MVALGGGDRAVCIVARSERASGAPQRHALFERSPDFRSHGNSPQLRMTEGVRADYGVKTGCCHQGISATAWWRFPKMRRCSAACFNTDFMRARVYADIISEICFLAALTHITGDFAEAVKVSGKVLAIRGTIYPSTVSNVNLVATLVNGKRVRGETKISSSRSPIQKIELEPRRVRPLPKAVEAIQEADLILLGPGSLYTSVIPNLLIPDIARAIARSKAPRVYIANLMTQPGETTNYTLSEHLRAIEAHFGKRLVDYVVANKRAASPEVVRRYRTQGAAPVKIDADRVSKMKVKLRLDNLLEEHGVIRHNSPRLARLLVRKFLQ